MSTLGEAQKQILDKLNKDPEHAIELREQPKKQPGVPLEIYIKGMLKSLSEVKQMVGG